MNTSGCTRTSHTARLVVLVAVLLFAPALAACSGPGADMSMRRNMGIGFVCFVGASVVAIPVLLMRLKRRGFALRAFLPLFGLIFHPAWWIGAGGGDCGYLRRDASMVLSVAWVVLLVYEAIRLGSTRRPERHRLGKAGVAIIFVLLGASVATWFLPWTLHPLPTQSRFLRYTSIQHVRKYQQDYKEEHGVFAASANQLHGQERSTYLGEFEGWLENGDGEFVASDHHNMHYARVLQGTPANPRAWQVEDGLSDWAVIVRPVNFPARGE